MMHHVGQPGRCGRDQVSKYAGLGANGESCEHLTSLTSPPRPNILFWGARPSLHDAQVATTTEAYRVAMKRGQPSVELRKEAIAGTRPQDALHVDSSCTDINLETLG